MYSAPHHTYERISSRPCPSWGRLVFLQFLLSLSSVHGLLLPPKLSPRVEIHQSSFDGVVDGAILLPHCQTYIRVELGNAAV